ncbi:MAG: riboflavin biosynthesis protein RibF [Planctomycetes bacterium]|jgi:riboflavin kinase/FMN adenylyltransferase|nr:riboflavin biosynthesis protein RibF [Planctomycetota bacterium]
MRLIEGLDALQALDLRATYGDAPPSQSVVAVGVFDGVHLGHHRLLHQLLEMSSALQGMPTVVTFANHPDQVLLGQAPPLLVSVPHRLRLLRRAGVLRLVLLQFEPRLQNMTAREFAQRILVERLHARGLLLGYDSALGKDRAGTPEHFRELGQEFGFEVRTGAPFEVDGQPVSSTAIRQAIARGDLALARRFLGRFPGALGTVVHGSARGRELGFPTANVRLQSGALPPAGVYAVEAIVDGQIHPAVANLGVRPTFATATGGANDAMQLEVHLLDFQGDLYDRELEVMFRQLLRPEQKFASVEALRAQIARDAQAAREALRA